MNTQLTSPNFITERVLVLDANIESANAAYPDDLVADSTNMVYKVSAGQVGFLSKDDTTYNVLVDTPAFDDIKKFTIIQGTGNTSITAQTGHGYTEKPFIESMVIDKRFPIWFDSAYVVNERYDSVKVTGYTGTLSLTRHALNINQAGVILQHQNSMEMRDGFQVTYNTPDYATLGTAAANAKNDIYTNLGYKANLMSSAVHPVPTLTGNQPFICFAMEVAGGASSQNVNGNAVTCPLVSDIIAGTSASQITFMNVVRNGIGYIQKFTITTSLREALQEAVAAGTLSASSRIRVIDPLTALTLAKIDQLLFVALDSPEALVENRESAVKTQIFVTAPLPANQSFMAVTMAPVPTITRTSTSYEGQGKGNQWLIRWKNYAKNDLYTMQNYGWSYKFITMPDYVKKSTNYNVFTLLHGVEVDDFSPHDEHYYCTFILIPNMIPLTFANGTAEAYAQVDTDGKIIGTYIADGGTGGSGAVTIAGTYLGSGATITATYTLGVVTALTITAAGSGYSNLAPIGSTATTSLPLPVADLNTWLGGNITTTENGVTVTFA